MAPVQVRRAVAGERDAVAAMVASAFAHDPGWRFLFGEQYSRMAPLFAAALFDVRVALDAVWVSGDLSSVSMWDPPERSEPERRRALAIWERLADLADEPSRVRMREYNAAVAALLPDERHWYLGVLATHPARRGEGLASAVLEPAVEQADSDRLACCLETSTEENRGFYTRRGFTEAAAVDLPTGPPTWLMRRPPV